MRNHIFISFSIFLFNGCVNMEWRGGMIPHIGLSKDVPPENQTIANNSVSLRKNSTQWNQYRGPNRDGHIPAQGVVINWEEKPKPLWKVSSGAGHSSVIISGKTVFTLEQIGNSETLLARDLSSGKEKWKVAQHTKWDDMMSGTGPRSTPTLLNGKIFTLFSNGVLCCVNAKTGKAEWKTNTIDTEYEYPEWGISCSPLIWNELIILNLGGEKSAVRAYSVNDGKLVWESDLFGKGVYISSSILTLLGEDHLLAAVEGKIAGLNPKTGKTLWEKSWKIFLNNVQITQPIALSQNSFLLSAGYGKGAECWTLSQGANKEYLIETSWKSKNLKSKFSNPVLKNGYLYGLSENLLVCMEAKTGELKWRGKKYGYGRILVSKDKLLILGNTGVLSIVEASPNKFKEVFSGQLLSEARCWNGPALAGGYLVAMNGEELSCFDWEK
ncbi:MAG: PQQ-binding-like beta-propeller repeat protein [Opitutales bacterium]|nr:PQQ-binding-like beta-propeller repeat protein [Opitutales bacterium]